MTTGPRSGAGPAGLPGIAGRDGTVRSSSAAASNAISVSGSETVLAFGVEADARSTLLVVGAVATRSAAGVTVQVVVNGTPVEPPFRTDLVDALIPVAVHAQLEVEAGSHLVELRVSGAEPVAVEERIATALVFGEAQ